MSYCIVGWLLLGGLVGLLYKNIFSPEALLVRGNWTLFGTLGAWFGGSLAYLMHFSLLPTHPAHWIFALFGSVAFLTLRFLGVQPRTIY